MPAKPLTERILENSIPVTETGCWLWQRIGAQGYGRIKVAGKTSSAHRKSWEAFHGPIPEGKQVCHKCDTRSCVNPDHLFLGSPWDNTRDAHAKGRLTGWLMGKTKLTSNQVMEIRASTESNKVLAEKYNTSASNIRSIKSGQSWRHLLIGN